MDTDLFLQRLRELPIEDGRTYIQELIAELADHKAIGELLAEEALRVLYTPFPSLKLAELLIFYGELAGDVYSHALGLKAKGDALMMIGHHQAALEASELGHGFLTYALVEEGLKKGEADREPKDGRILIREWVDFAVARVPEMQAAALHGSRALKLVFAQGDEKVDEPTKRNLQRPRVFYRREMEPQPLVVEKINKPR